MAFTRWQQISAANSGSSTVRNDSKNRTYISTTSRITSGDELRHRNGEGSLALDPRLIIARYH